MTCLTKISKSGLNFLKSLEGFRETAYQDGGGVWTIGYGHTLTACKGMVVTKRQAEILLQQDIRASEMCVTSCIDVPLRQNQYDALVCFVFNIGCFAFSDSTLVKKLNTGDYDSVPEQLRRWNKIQGKVSNGLTNRREKEVELWDRYKINALGK